jgi:phosphoribosylformylglycinamidine cyclo-ligase
MAERPPLRIAILVSGEGTTLEAIAEAVAQRGLNAEIVLVASDRPGAHALERAQRRGIPTLVLLPPPKGSPQWETVLASQLAAAGTELVVLAGFLRILRGPLLERFAGRIINLHPSLLPKYGGPGMYGIRVHQAVLDSGDPETGSTVHLVTKDVDRGPTLRQESFRVVPGETAEQLSERQKQLEHALMVDVLRSFASGELGLPWNPTTVTTYAVAGVNTDQVRKGIAALARAVRYRPPRSRGLKVGGEGGFAGILDAGGQKMALTTDGVGTKVLLAEALGRWREVGQDMVAVNVNDITAIGALPVALVDHIMCRAPEAKVLAEIGRGLNAGLSQAGCHLLGGETAVVPELLTGTYDLSATALGIFGKGTGPLTGERIEPGDVLLGLPSSGFHANGYTLVRRILSTYRIPLDQSIPGDKLPLGRALLRPTTIYAPFVEPLLQRKLPTGLAHITGGGFRKNLMRLNRKVRFTLDEFPEARGLFAWIPGPSGLRPEELYKTFNMGIGFVVAVREKDADKALRLLRSRRGSGARILGHVDKGTGVSIPSVNVQFSGY